MLRPLFLAFNMCPVPVMPAALPIAVHKVCAASRIAVHKDMLPREAVHKACCAASQIAVHKGPCLEPRRCLYETGASRMPTSLMTCAAGSCTRLFPLPFEIVGARIRQARGTRLISLTCSGTPMMCSGSNGRNNGMLPTKSSTTSPAIPTSSKSNLWYGVSASFLHVFGPFGFLPPLFDGSLSRDPAG